MAEHTEHYQLNLIEDKEKERHEIKKVNSNNVLIDKVMSDNADGNLDNKNHLTEIQNDLLAYKSTVSNTYETKLNATTHKDNVDNPHLVTKEQVGLGSVENVALSSHTGKKDNPHFVTKAQVGLGNVDNTADLDKPIPSLVEQALQGKASLNNFLDYGYVSSTELSANTSGTWRVNLSNFPLFSGMTSNNVNILQYGSSNMVTQLLTDNIGKQVYVRTRLSNSNFAAWNSDWTTIGADTTALNGKQESQLNVANATNILKLNGRNENQLNVSNAYDGGAFGFYPQGGVQLANDVTTVVSYDGYLIARSFPNSYAELYIWIIGLRVV